MNVSIDWPVPSSVQLLAVLRPVRAVSDSDALSFLWEQSCAQVVCQHVREQIGGLQRSRWLRAAVAFWV